MVEQNKPSSKDANLYESGFDLLLENQSLDIVSKLHWSLNLNRQLAREGRYVLHSGTLLHSIDGTLRGDLAERLSSILGMEDCETVYSSLGDRHTQLAPVTFEEYFGTRSKVDVLYRVVKNSFYNNPAHNLIELISSQIQYPNQLNKEYKKHVWEIVEGYCTSGSGGDATKGLFFSELRKPDGLLVGLTGSVDGLVEIKAYIPEEVSAMIDNHSIEYHGEFKEITADYTYDTGKRTVTYELNMYLSKEIAFIDTIRQLGYGLSRLGQDMNILLRFPKDSNYEDLYEYGELLRSLGYKNLIIQRLPLTTVELRKKAKDILRKHWDKIKGNKINKCMFKRYEIENLEIYLFGRNM